MTDYHFDVFVSYERDGLTAGWIKEHFLPLLRTWLRSEIRAVCNRPALPIFFDKALVDPDFPDGLKLGISGIDPGDPWEEGLKKGLRHSRCLVGIWNPPYFDSHWCNVEWVSFERRMTRTGRRLIIASSFHDGACFPEKAAAIERFDLRPFTLFGPALVNSRQYEGFQKMMQLIARRVAEAIRDAPQFEEWEVADDIPPPPPRPPLGVTRFADGG